MSDALEGLLKAYKLEIGREFDTDDGAMTTGEVTLELDFEDGVEFDIDGEDGDGTIYVQYWKENNE